MNFQQIRSFVEVADTGSFSKAAHAMFTSPVNVFKQMNALEKEYKTTFFIREVKGCRLTKEGKVFLEKARELLKTYNELNASLSVNSVNHKILKVGFDSNCGEDFLKKLISSLSRFPDINLELIRCSYYDFFEAITNKEIDISFVAKPNSRCPKRIIYRELLNADYYALYRKEKEYFTGDGVDINDLKDHDIYLTAIRYSDVYDEFVHSVGSKHLHSMGISEFISQKTDGIYITTGRTKEISEDYCLKTINGLSSSWGIIYWKKNEMISDELIQSISEIFE